MSIALQLTLIGNTMRHLCLIVLLSWLPAKCVADADLTHELLSAARRGQADTIQALLAQGSNVDTRNLVGETALIQAAEKGRLEVVELLITHHAEVNAQDKLGWTALMRAAYEGHLKVMERLIAAGATLSLKNRHGATALMSAAYGGHADCVQVLLSAGAEVNARNNLEESSLMAAVQRGHSAVLNALLDGGADLHARDRDGMTAFLHGVFLGREDVTRLLLDRGSNVLDEGGYGWNALRRAASRGYTGIVRALLESGAPVNAASKPLTPHALRPDPSHAFSRLRSCRNGSSASVWQRQYQCEGFQRFDSVNQGCFKRACSGCGDPAGSGSGSKRRECVPVECLAIGSSERAPGDGARVAPSRSSCKSGERSGHDSPNVCSSKWTSQDCRMSLGC